MGAEESNALKREPLSPPVPHMNPKELKPLLADKVEGNKSSMTHTHRIQNAEKDVE